MGIVRDLYYARKMSAGLKLPAPTVALLIKRLRLAAAMGGGIEKTVSGTMVHITDALAKAALSVLVSISPIQDLHGYDHPWPAGGGINKAKLVYKTASASVGYRNLQDNSVTVYTDNTSAEYRFAQFALLDVEDYAGQTLTFTAKAQQVAGSSTPRIQGRLYDSNGSAVGSAIFEKTGTSITRTFTLPATIDSGVTFRVNLYCNSGWAQASETNFSEIQVEVSSTAHDFAPYENNCPISGRTGLSVYVGPTQDQQDATTYSVDWTTEAGTVYGGTLDVVTGVLTVDKGYVDMGSLSWSRNATYNVMYAYVAGKARGRGNLICSNYKTVDLSYEDLSSGEISGSINTVNAINVKDDAYTSAADFTTAMNGVQLVYELATPLTYQLTPQEVQMLLGENYVWSSSGDTVSVTYYAEGNANDLQSLNILLGGNYSNPKTADDVSDKEALEIILGGNK